MEVEEIKDIEPEEVFHDDNEEFDLDEYLREQEEKKKKTPVKSTIAPVDWSSGIERPVSIIG